MSPSEWRARGVGGAVLGTAGVGGSGERRLRRWLWQQQHQQRQQVGANLLQADAPAVSKQSSEFVCPSEEDPVVVASSSAARHSVVVALALDVALVLCERRGSSCRFTMLCAKCLAERNWLAWSVIATATDCLHNRRHICTALGSSAAIRVRGPRHTMRGSSVAS